MKIFSFLFLWVTLGSISATSHAETLKEDTSLFAKPSISAKQLQILRSGTQVEVTGKSVEKKGMDWLPVEIDGVPGYLVSTPELFIESPSVETPLPPRIPKLIGRIWIADGPALINSYGTSTVGNNLTLGGQLNFGKDQRLLVGGSLDFLQSSETSADSQIGKIRRGALLLHLGYFIVPDMISLSVRGGLSGIGFDGTSSNTTILQWTTGPSLSVDFFRSKALVLSAQMNYLYTGSASANPLFLSIFGSGGTVSSASVFSGQLACSYELKI